MKTSTEYFGNSKLVSQHLEEQGTEIKPGDWYIAKRNGPPQVLKCHTVKEDSGWVYPAPETPGYSFDIHECQPFKNSVAEQTMQAIYEQCRKEVLEWQESIKRSRLKL
jgi:hypothetical protein